MVTFYNLSLYNLKLNLPNGTLLDKALLMLMRCEGGQNTPSKRKSVKAEYVRSYPAGNVPEDMLKGLGLKKETGNQQANFSNQTIRANLSDQIIISLYVFITVIFLIVN